MFGQLPIGYRREYYVNPDTGKIETRYVPGRGYRASQEVQSNLGGVAEFIGSGLGYLESWGPTIVLTVLGTSVAGPVGGTVGFVMGMASKTVAGGIHNLFRK